METQLLISSTSREDDRFSPNNYTACGGCKQATQPVYGFYRPSTCSPFRVDDRKMDDRKASAASSTDGLNSGEIRS